jgi:hypothetical protein
MRRSSILYVVLGVVLVVMSKGSAPAGSNERSDCNIERSPCVKFTNSGVQVEFEITPRRVRAMQELEFIVTLRDGGIPVSGASLLLDLSMPGMFMGNNQPKLTEEQNGRYRGRGVIPKCPTGQRIWKALIAIARGHQVEKVSYLFEVSDGN